MKSFACLILLSFILGITSARSSQVPASDQLYGIYIGFGGKDTETIAQTVSVDIDSGTMTKLVTNFIYAGSSITATGISTFDNQRQQLYYATNVASAFIFGADITEKVLLPPVDIGAATILDLKMDSENGTLYISFQDSENSVLIASYSDDGGPIRYLANLTDLLASEAAQMGESALDSVNDILYFISYTDNGEALNIIHLSNLSSAVVNPISSACQKQFDFLFTDPVTNNIYGILEIDGAKNVRYSFATMDASGACNSTMITDEPLGLITAFTYSPYSNRLYYSMESDSGDAFICYLQVPLSGVPTCNPAKGVLVNLEVSYPQSL